MKKMIRQLLFAFAFIITAFIMVNVSFVDAKAKVKDGTYYFSSAYTSKFKVKNNKLTIKMKGKYGKITKKGNSSFSKKKITVKVSKKCKYYTEYFMRGTGVHGITKSKYKAVKQYVDFDRKNKARINAGLSRFVVKKGKVVKIVYFSM